MWVADDLRVPRVCVCVCMCVCVFLIFWFTFRVTFGRPSGARVCVSMTVGCSSGVFYRLVLVSNDLRAPFGSSRVGFG